MPEAVSVIIFVAVFFAAMILRLATSQGFASKLTGWLVVIAAFGGFIFYGYAYAQHESDPFLAVIRALLSVCDMFTGSVDENAIDYAKLNTNPPSLILFWLIHLMALYATASATISVIGAEALRKLRLWFSRWGDLYIIYSATTESVEFGHKLVGTKKHPLVFVDPAPSSGVVNGINKSGFLLRSDSNALLANKHFAKSIGIRRKRKITLYAIGKDGAQNLSYAKAFLDTLQQLHVQPENTRLLILGVNEYIAMDLQSTDQSYGYGAVSHIKESELAARVLINLYHPSQTIQFNAEGMAQENFHALVIGFGQIGQNVLKQLIINGQFYGSEFRCDVFDPNTNAISKFLPPQIQQRYQVIFHNSAANIEELDAFLSSNLNSLKYVVICTGSDEANSKLALEIALCCMHKQVQIPIYQCSRESITQTTVNLSRCQSSNAAWFDTDDLDPGTLRSQKTSLYDPWFMCFDSSDILAMRIHKSYFGTAQNELQLWMTLSHFFRVSNRSAADYLTALFHAVGIAQNGQLCTAIPPQGSLLENLAHSEHLRWCAFHFCHGYATMSMDEFEERARIFMKEVEEYGKSSIRIAKNNVTRTHACLISWDELDYLSQCESCITCKPINYKQVDRNNILTVWQTMKTQEAVLWPYRK